MFPKGKYYNTSVLRGSSWNKSVESLLVQGFTKKVHRPYMVLQYMKSAHEGSHHEQIFYVLTIKRLMDQKRSMDDKFIQRLNFRELEFMV